MELTPPLGTWQGLQLRRHGEFQVDLLHLAFSSCPCFLFQLILVLLLEVAVDLEAPVCQVIACQNQSWPLAKHKRFAKAPDVFKMVQPQKNHSFDL